MEQSSSLMDRHPMEASANLKAELRPYQKVLQQLKRMERFSQFFLRSRHCFHPVGLLLAYSGGLLQVLFLRAIISLSCRVITSLSSRALTSLFCETLINSTIHEAYPFCLDWQRSAVHLSKSLDSASDSV